MIQPDANRAEVLRSLQLLCRNPNRELRLDSRSRVSTGILALDEMLPGGGVEKGSLVEWLVPGDGSGAAVLALQCMRPVVEHQGVWAIIDPAGEFYPPAAQGWGVPLERLLWLRPESVADVAWTAEQCLRCPAVGITWFRAESLPDRVLQRWKIAAEVGGGIGVLFRPARVARSPSWADVRWLVRPQPAMTTATRRLRIELLFCRGACHTGASVELEVCNATSDVRVVSAVASATHEVRTVGA